MKKILLLAISLFSLNGLIAQNAVPAEAESAATEQLKPATNAAEAPNEAIKEEKVKVEEAQAEENKEAKENMIMRAWESVKKSVEDFFEKIKSFFVKKK